MTSKYDKILMTIGIILLVTAVIGGILFFKKMIQNYEIEYDRAAIDEAADYLGVEICYVKHDGNAYFTWADVEFDLLAVYAQAKEAK